MKKKASGLGGDTTWAPNEKSGYQPKINRLEDNQMNFHFSMTEKKTTRKQD